MKLTEIQYIIYVQYINVKIFTSAVNYFFPLLLLLLLQLVQHINRDIRPFQTAGLSDGERHSSVDGDGDGDVHQPCGSLLIVGDGEHVTRRWIGK